MTLTCILMAGSLWLFDQEHEQLLRVDAINLYNQTRTSGILTTNNRQYTSSRSFEEIMSALKSCPEKPNS